MEGGPADVAPRGDGVDHLLLGIVLDAVHQVLAQAVGGVDPAGAQVVGQTHQRIILVLLQLDAVLFEEAVELGLHVHHVLPHQRLRLVGGDAVGELILAAEGAAADVPLAPVLVGEAAVALKVLDQLHTLIADGHGLHIGQGGGGQQSGGQQQGQQQRAKSFHHRAHTPHIVFSCGLFVCSCLSGRCQGRKGSLIQQNSTQKCLHYSTWRLV